MSDGNAPLVQTVLGVPDEAGAVFLFDDEMKVIGGPADCDTVLRTAWLCDGTRTADEVLAAAGAAEISPEQAGTVLAILRAEGIIHEVARPEAVLESRDVRRANGLMARFVGDGKLISLLDVYKPGLDDDATVFPYFVANGQFAFADGTPYTCHGAAPAPSMAVVKSIAEAVERYHNGATIRIDAFGQARTLPHPAVVFESVTRQRPEYLAARGLSPFGPEDEHPWVLGHHLGSGEPVYVLADMIYHPATSAQLGRPKVSHMLASGSAAHFERHEAIRRGLLEIVERDALAATWYAKRPVTAIPFEQAPPEIRDRLQAWCDWGREFRLLNLTLDSVPVVLALSEGDRYPFISAGCAAAETLDEAMVKAFLEGELLAVSWANVQDPLPALAAALSPVDHGLLYAHPGNEHRVDWLLDAPVETPVETSVDLNALIRRFDPIVVDLHRPEDAADLWVVKVLSNKTLPITFGHGSEPHGHARLAELGLRWGEYPSYPHFLS
ncbi:MAG TPA: YcaO-like family protein [Roseiflexaceae bacterium]|nr:YcaO-like family protein [Roseiflexaceae bacterium]